MIYYSENHLYSERVPSTETNIAIAIKASNKSSLKLSLKNPAFTLDRARVKPGRAVAMHAQSLAGTLNVGCEPDKRRPHAATEQCEKSNFELLPHGQSSCTLRRGSPFALAPFLAFDEKQSDEQDAQKGSWSCVYLLLQDLVQSRRLTHVVLPTATCRSRIMQSRQSRV